MTGENPDNYSLCLLRRDNLQVARNGLLAGIFIEDASIFSSRATIWRVLAARSAIGS
jgi:hypothetical protein